MNATSLSPMSNYYLNVLGGNAITHNTRLVRDTDGTLLIPGAANTTSTYTSPLVTFGPDPQTLIIPPSPASAGPTQYYVLKGPSGRGVYKLYLSDEVELPKGIIGSSTRWESWDIESRSGMLWLRDSGLAGQGFWVMVPGEDTQGAEAWALWWLSPSGAAIDVLKNHVMVNVEVVEEEKKE